mmetsp:Transcript_104947/g.296568  ORF Transcript_104947/g.296568 Transcript_104947/m.296568 type:complete len:257 (-) Transcript_104947:644-1414(-)
MGPHRQVRVVREELQHGVVPELLAQGPLLEVHDRLEARLDDPALCLARAAERHGLRDPLQPRVQHLEAALQRRLHRLDPGEVGGEDLGGPEGQVVERQQQRRREPYAAEHHREEEEGLRHGESKRREMEADGIKEPLQLCESLDRVLDGGHMRTLGVHDLQESSVAPEASLELDCSIPPKAGYQIFSLKLEELLDRNAQNRKEKVSKHLAENLGLVATDPCTRHACLPAPHHPTNRQPETEEARGEQEPPKDTTAG